MEEVRDTDSKGDRAPVRLAVLQRVCTNYRRGLIRDISKIPGYETRVFLGDDLPNSKVRSAADLSDINVTRLPTRFITFRKRVYIHHKGLGKALADYSPDVILCEGESNILSYLKAIRYARKHKNTAIIHWSLGSIPGAPTSSRSIASRIKLYFQKKFDAFVLYSSYGKQYMASVGHSSDELFVATNVADTRDHLERASSMTESPSEARAKLGLPDRFTVFYVGAMDANKHPEMLLDMAERLDLDQYNYVLLGKGPLLSTFQERIKTQGLANVFLPGHVREELPLYYRAADVMVLPGRGGMVMSEAMAWSLPIVVYQADGTEYDLVRNGENGFRLEKGTLEDFQNTIEFLKNNPEKAKSMGNTGRDLLVERFTTKHMVNQIIKAVDYALAKKSST